MECPVVQSTDALNCISARITFVERRINHLLGMISILHTENENISLATDIAKFQLEILKNYLQQPVQERDFQTIAPQIDKKIEEIREIYLEDYSNLLKARGDIMEGGKHVPLTHEKTKQLMQSFQETLNGKIAQERLQIDDTTRLEFTIQSLEEKSYRGEVLINALFKEKQEMADDLEDDLRPKLDQLISERNDLRKAPEINNIFIACQFGALEYIQKRIDEQPKGLRRDFINGKDSQGFAPIHLAAYHDRTAILALLIEKGADVNIRDATGYQAIHWAAKKGAYGPTNILIKKGASVNGKGSYGRTPLHMAVYNHRLRVAKLLITNEANINAQTDPEDNLKTPLHDAVIRGDKEMVTYLSEWPDLDVNITDRLGWSPIRHALEDGLTTIFRLLVLHLSWSPPEESENLNSIASICKSICDPSTKASLRKEEFFDAFTDACDALNKRRQKRTASSNKKIREES